ncbi:hypothetical protein [Actinokineospora cianjurensis]|uniref:SMODS and SLOG-associating 2TM effector domain-containing protein n=1 Tax=Actinokineospora cianjurensis TaxID=585224 RepID=A0A421B9D7_9PSEU|nr:hypothetical protein [Actinokineospora cianjurensis]RLK61152.1 hypothetical protein CLV68_1667 [Actinokineospora cianjurensis]
MNDAISGWLDQNMERVAVRQRSQADTAKLVVTFSTAVSATLVGTSLQVDIPNWWDTAASFLLAISCLLAIAVIFGDRLREPDPRDELVRAYSEQRDELVVLAELRRSAVEAAKINDRILQKMSYLVNLQISFAAFAAIFSLVALTYIRWA